jgi:hypothetical protein
MGLLIALGTVSAQAQDLASFDFTKPGDAAGWRPLHDVSRVEPTAEGIRITTSGPDPYIVGGQRDLPAGRPLWMRIRLRSEQGGLGQLFYYADQRPTNEADSVRFPVRAGVWEDIRAPLPALGPGTRFRIDPPGQAGSCVIASLAFQERTITPEPAWPAPTRPKLEAPLYGLSSGDMRLVHGAEVGGFTVDVAGVRMAVGHTHPLIGYRKEGRVKWLDLAKVAAVSTDKQGSRLTVNTVARDEDGARWEIVQEFADTPVKGALGVRITVTVDQDRDVLFLPLMILLPGSGSFGAEKGQAIFPGLEYLDRQASEVSSSEADISGPGARRKVPDTERITVPLMAIQARDRFVGLIWQPSDRVCALFDSPDRTFGGGGHAMALLFPGSNGLNREEASAIPYDTERLAAGKPFEAKGVLIGGKGSSVVPAVQLYVNNIPLPKPPESDVLLRNYVSLAAAGWLDSKIHGGDRFRHAWPGGFQPQPAADAAVWMEWLAAQTSAPGADRALAPRLQQAARAAVAVVDLAAYNVTGVGHVRYPVASLLFGHVAENLDTAQRQAADLLGRFEPDGSIPYHKSPNGLDYGKTHFAPDANGLTAQVVSSQLQAAAACGDRTLIAEGIKRLHGLDRFLNTVPRGAQTWEVPLHTPDILASAYLVRAYTLGFELTGDQALLEKAQYWAWTGVPFVYLVNPTGQPVGPYATIPVLGATQWVAPNWMGLPVQWCGLVYADALYGLRKHDPYGPWRKLADGITASGIQQTWPLGKDPDRVGLLPDSFALRPQMRNDAAINPATLLACAQRLYNRPLVYDYRVFRGYQLAGAPLIAHAPGEIVEVGQKSGKVVFKVKGWSVQPYRVLLVGLKSRPEVTVGGKPVASVEWLAAQGALAVTVTGQPTVEIQAR